MGVEANEEMLDKVAQTAMTGKSAEADKEHLADICVEVAMAAPLEDINIVRRPNGKIRDSTAIAGLLIDGAKGISRNARCGRRPKDWSHRCGH